MVVLLVTGMAEHVGIPGRGSKDVLASSEDAGADVFDFKSMRPSINKMKNKLSSLDIRRASNMLRCDPLKRKYMDKYQQLAKRMKGQKKL
jgi:hypothetical protein